MKTKILTGLLFFGISICFSGAFAADWYPSKWGQDDELGAANLLPPDLVLKVSGVTKLGIEKIPPIVTRAVLINKV